ncbi:MAG: 30S ribosomal protein S16 [Hyphomicrobiaceae bacterium hypho_1]
MEIAALSTGENQIMSVVKLRLTRSGSKKRPYYHIVAASNTAPRDGRYIERVGSYNPMVAKDHIERLTLKEERCRHWLSIGAQPTDRVSRFLESAGLIEAKTRNNPKKALPGKKRLEREAAASEETQ